jgi:streptogramin lyase
MRSASRTLACAVGLLAGLAAGSSAERIRGSVSDGSGAALVGAQVTAESGEPAHRISVWTDAAGRFATPEVGSAATWTLRARRIGFRDAVQSGIAPGAELALVAERITDPAAVAAQLPAHHWWSLVIERFEGEKERQRLKRECTFCHQQGNEVTRRPRPAEEWQKVIGLMERRGARLDNLLHEQLAAALVLAYDPAVAVPRLTEGWQDAEAFAPSPPPEVRRALVEEWDLGSRASMQHDVIVHPDGRVYSVDGSQDQLHRLDPTSGKREAWPVPQGDRPLGGIFGEARGPVSQTAVAKVGPHSLQVAPDGSVWLTLAIGNQLARFDPDSERFEIHDVAEGYYPHTLRFDAKGRIWYTMAASNHVGMFDPKTGEQRHVRLPARTLQQEIVLRLLPAMMWLDQRIDLRSASSGSADGFTMPVPYGIDIAPDGGVWFSQLNEDRIGRIDPDTLAVELFETPFPAPRRLRFDRSGTLWVPSFSAGLLAAFDPRTRSYRSYELPTRPLLGEVPYALAVNPLTQDVWVCGTNSDTLMRFTPPDAATGDEAGRERMRAAWTGAGAVDAASGGSSPRNATGDEAGRERMRGAWTVFPLPTRVTYTRELDFDAAGRVWTSNSNSPAWQIEGGQPRVLRLDPDPSASAALLARSARGE